MKTKLETPVLGGSLRALLLVCGACASPAPRPALEPLPAADLATGLDAAPELPRPRVEVSPPSYAIEHVPAAAGHPGVVRVTIPSAPTTVMLLAFPVLGTKSTLGLEALTIDLARRRLIRALPVGADGFGRANGTMLRLKAVGLPSKAAAMLPAFGKALERKKAFGDFKKDRFDFLQSLVASSGVSRTLARMGRYGREHPWAQGPAARVNALSKVKTKVVERAWSQLLDLRRATFLILGPPEGLPSVGEILAGLPRSDPSQPLPKRQPPPPVPPLEEEKGNQFHALWFNNDQVLMQALHVGPDLSHDDYPAFLLLEEAIGGFTSEGNRRLRHQGGASYGVGASMRTLPGASELVYGGWIDAQRGMQLFDTHQEVVERVRDHGLTEEEIRSARAQVLGSWARRMDEPEEVANLLAWCVLTGRSPSADDCLAPPDVSVSSAKTQEVARRYLHRDRVHWLVYGEMDHIHNPLRFKGVINFYKIERLDPPD
ncbi:MAG: insulinase family protein [Myxococcota bacterium]